MVSLLLAKNINSSFLIVDDICQLTGYPYQLPILKLVTFGHSMVRIFNEGNLLDFAFSKLMVEEQLAK